jgi:retron-type reverse transcriptase
LKIKWNQINWEQAETYINRLQIRIVKATLDEKWRLVKRLQYLITHSFYGRAIAVKRVISNKGKNTPGIDGVVWKTDNAKERAIINLETKRFTASPLRRIFIEKFGKMERRPLGIPTMSDRAMQALQLLSLEPISETKADTVSFGFRGNRGAHDAKEYAFSNLCRKDSPQWILEGDIRGYFDNISHQWLAETSLDHCIWEMLWKWSRRRHPNKGKGWIVKKYWKNHKGRSWSFMSEKNILFYMNDMPILRNTQLRLNTNPFLDLEYFEKRDKDKKLRRLKAMKSNKAALIGYYAL